jgi:hypothetical protein
MKAAADTESKSFANYLLDERNSVGLFTCVAFGSGLVGLVTHFLRPPVWMPVTATFAWVLACPHILRWIRGAVCTAARDVAVLRRYAGETHGAFCGVRRALPVSLVVAASAAAIVLISYVLMIGINVGPADRVIMTGANESAVEQLSDGSVLSLDARSTVNVTVTGKQRVTRLVEGEVIFNVATHATMPFVVQTFLAKVTSEGGKFRVAIDSSVEVEVYDGVVQVAANGTTAAAAVILHKGDPPYRVPVPAVAAVDANRSGTGGARSAVRETPNDVACERIAKRVAHVPVAIWDRAADRFGVRVE